MLSEHDPAPVGDDGPVGCPRCRLIAGLAERLRDEDAGVAFDLVERLLDCLEAVRGCYGGGDQEDAEDAAEALAGLVDELRDLADGDRPQGCSVRADE